MKYGTNPEYGKKSSGKGKAKGALKVKDNRQCVKCGTYDAKKVMKG